MNKSRKHIIIAGVPRAGKTTICSKLAQSLKYQHLDMDSILISLEKAFPLTGVLHTDCWEFIETSKIFVKFMKEFSKTRNYDKFAYRLAFDLYHITPKDYCENIDPNDCEIYFFGYPNISAEQKIKEIRKYDTKYDWTVNCNDSLLTNHITKYIEISKWLQKECKNYNLPFIDISNNREKVIENFVKDILSR